MQSRRLTLCWADSAFPSQSGDPDMHFAKANRLSPADAVCPIKSQLIEVIQPSIVGIFSAQLNPHRPAGSTFSLLSYSHPGLRTFFRTVRNVISGSHIGAARCARGVLGGHIKEPSTKGLRRA